MARAQGEAYARALRVATQRFGAHTREGGNYLVVLFMEPAQGVYRPANGAGLEWWAQADANAHLGVAVVDRVDGRFVPGLMVRATIWAADGSLAGDHWLSFAWHPFLYHYGANIRLPGQGDYRVRVRADPARFLRHDPVAGRRYAAAVEVNIAAVHVNPDQIPGPQAQSHVPGPGGDNE